MALRPIPGAPEGSADDLPFPAASPAPEEEPADAGTSEAPSDVPGLNRIGAMLDDLRKNIQQNQRWALKDWVEGAKLLVIATDVHKLKGDDYVQFACAHLPIEGKSQDAKARAAYDLYLLGYAEEGQPANGDLVIQECEVQAKLRPHNFEWPYWRTVTTRLRKAAKEKQQGDGIPAGEAAEDTAPDVEQAPVDPVAQMDAEIQRLRAELQAARQSFRSERAAREEVQDALHRLRADITRVLSVSEKAMWDAMPRPSPPESPTPEPRPDPTSAIAPEPEPPRTVEEAVSLIYRRGQTETCETVAEALQSVPMQEWERDDFDRLFEALEECAHWYGDHNDMVQTLFSYERAPILFGAADGVLIYEDGLKVLTWPEAMERIALEVEEAKRELERRQQELRRIMRTKLPMKRKLKAMKSLLSEVTALQPTTISLEAERAIDFIRAMRKDDERFIGCKTFDDYLRKAAAITAPPEPPKVLMLPPPEPMSVPLRTDYGGNAPMS